MLDRAQIVDEQFIESVKKAHFPVVDLSSLELEKKLALELFNSQIQSRLLDLIARQLKEQGLGYYTIGSSGHEGNAVFGEIFRLNDMAFLHYRSAAFYLQRAKKIKEIDGLRDILLSLVAAAEEPIAGGRHKVLGSLPLNIPPQTSTIASHLPKALGAALAIIKAKELGIMSKLSPDAVILCSFGDASINHASAQATFNSCSWLSTQSYPLPLIFICEDNGLGISVPTPLTWVEASMRARPGLHYLSCDGLNISDIYVKTLQAQYLARIKKQPVFLHMKCRRLLGHAGSDIEFQYSTEAEITQREAADPLLYTASIIYHKGWMTREEILQLYQNNRLIIEAKAAEVSLLPKISSALMLKAPIIPPLSPMPSLPLPSPSLRAEIFGAAFPQLTMKRNLCQQINYALSDLMAQYPMMILFGEDVGKKGGVYRVTADLQARFGQRRVFDTLLDETTILGTAIGFAHNSFIPVPEIQFLAYFHNAEDQLRGEAATLSFFSQGQYQNPMIIRIAALAYQKGFGGHFHNDNSIAVLRDLPGIIVACPSNGPDAAKMLRTAMDLAYRESRIIVFLEPIALYMTKDLHKTGDQGWLFDYPKLEEKIEVGEVGTYGTGEIVILSYANGFYLACQAAKILKESHQIAVKLIDLRWLSPLPEKAILDEIHHAKAVLIVDEGRQSGSLSEGLMTLLVEKGPRDLKVKRLTGDDCFIPLGAAWEYILPSKTSIIEAVITLDSIKGE